MYFNFITILYAQEILKLSPEPRKSLLDTMGLTGANRDLLNLHPIDPNINLSFSQQLLNIINPIRIENKVKPLKINKKLIHAAKIHSEYMFKSGELRHEGPDGFQTYEDRVKLYNYDFLDLTESVHYDTHRIKYAKENFLNDPSKMDLILDPDFLDFGAYNINGYWTELLGTDKDEERIEESKNFHFDIKEMLKIVNDIRKENGKLPLTLNSKLSKTAQVQANFQNKTKKMSHYGENNNHVWDRAESLGYDYMAIGENVANNQRSVNSVMMAWKKSPGHFVNIISSDFTEFGAAVTNFWWAQVFGSPH